MKRPGPEKGASTRPGDGLTRPQKAAIVLASMNEESAAKVVDSLTDLELKAFARAFGKLRSVAAENLNAVAQEFASAVSARRGELPGGEEEAARLIKRLVDVERATRVFGAASAPGKGDIDNWPNIWAVIEKVDDGILLEFMTRQNKSIAAALLCRVGAEKAASLVALAERAFAREILLEAARRPFPPAALLDAIAEAIQEEIIEPLSKQPNFDHGGAVVGEIMNFLSTTDRDAVMEDLEKADREIAGAVKKVVVTFGDLAERLPSSGVQTVSRDIPRDILLRSLKYGETTAPKTIAHFMASLPKRMGEQLREEISELKPFGAAEGEAAHRALMAELRRLIADGAVKLMDLPPPIEASAGPV